MKQEISKQGYFALVWIPLILGLLINGITSTIGIFQGFSRYTAFFMGFGMLLIGFGGGMGASRGFKIRGFDK